jgi:N-glycosylase/DNA lyase
MPRIALNNSSPPNPDWQTRFVVRDYDLSSTLSSGQAFRWRDQGEVWEGIVADRWVRLHQADEILLAEVAADPGDWAWLAGYLQLEADITTIVRTFPDDEPMREAAKACCGLRLLRQPSWECLASFILSSTKQIVQIQEIIRLLCERFGEPIPVPPGSKPVFAFPTSARLARCSESDLRGCKMGFRAPYLLATARRIESGEPNLARLATLPLKEAREKLLGLPGVGRKIADCVLLFGCGFAKAFPVDVWVMRALRQLYFPRKRRLTLKQMQEFSERHFGPNAGYAQQYLFHYMRTSTVRRTEVRPGKPGLKRRQVPKAKSNA